MVGTAVPDTRDRFVHPAARIDLGAILRALGRRAPGRAVRAGRRRAGAELRRLRRAVNARAQGLRALGVERGAHVNLVLPNGLEYLALSYALKKLGAVEVAIDADAARGAARARAGPRRRRVTVTTPTLLG